MIITELKRILSKNFVMIKCKNKNDSLIFIYSMAMKTKNSIIITKSSFIPSLKKLKKSNLKISTDTSFKMILNCKIENIFIINRRFNRFEYGFLKNLNKNIVAIYYEPDDYDLILTKDNNFYKLDEIDFKIESFEIKDSEIKDF
ncbi:hypothetical protein DMUE_3083 [Dictyocoela muelleri]|nr:hypothetical protein DMUE_3083 [Dictyocoela muelleri]